MCIRVMKCGQGILCDWWMVGGKKRQDAKHVICLIMKQCLVSTCNKRWRHGLPGSSHSLCSSSTYLYSSLSLTRSVIRISSIRKPMFFYSAGKWCSQGFKLDFYVKWIIMNWHTVSFLSLSINSCIHHIVTNVLWHSISCKLPHHSVRGTCSF